MFKKKFFKKIDDIYVFDYKDEVTQKVKNFYKDDPFPNYEISDNKSTILSKGDKNFYTKNLKNFIGYNKKVLEIGAGTSQLSNYLAIGNNNSIVAFDVNFPSLKLGNVFAKNNKISNIDFVCGDIFHDIFKDEFFDIVLCNGVLHHTKNTFEAFKSSIKSLKKNGYVLVGLYNKYGRLRTYIRKYLYKLFGKRYLLLFDPVLRKINKDSSKKIYSWIRDQYMHPVERSHTFDDVLNWFDESNVEFVNSYPNCEFFNNDQNYILDDNVIFKNFFQQGKKSNYLDRIFSQLLMIFTKSGSEGGLYLFLGKKK